MFTLWHTCNSNIVLVVFLAKCESVPAVYLLESYLEMKRFESKVDPFCSFFSILWKKSLQSAPLSCPSTQTHAVLMNQAGIPPALVWGCDDLRYKRKSNRCKDWVQWGEQNFMWETYEAFGRAQICIFNMGKYSYWHWLDLKGLCNSADCDYFRLF